MDNSSSSKTRRRTLQSPINADNTSPRLYKTASTTSVIVTNKSTIPIVCATTCNKASNPNTFRPKPITTILPASLPPFSTTLTTLTTLSPPQFHPQLPIHLAPKTSFSPNEKNTHHYTANKHPQSPQNPNEKKFGIKRSCKHQKSQTTTAFQTRNKSADRPPQATPHQEPSHRTNHFH